GQSAEAFQSLAQPVLALRGQPPELGVAVKRFLLLLRRNIFVLAQPITGMMLLTRLTRTVLTASILISAIGTGPIRPLGERNGDTQRQNQAGHQADQRLVLVSHHIPNPPPGATMGLQSHPTEPADQNRSTSRDYCRVAADR